MFEAAIDFARGYVLTRVPNNNLGKRSLAPARARLSELLLDAAKDFVREFRILHGASQNNSTDHRDCLKDGFFSISTLSGENVLESLLECGFKFSRASHLVAQCSCHLDCLGATDSVGKRVRKNPVTFVTL